MEAETTAIEKLEREIKFEKSEKVEGEVGGKERKVERSIFKAKERSKKLIVPAEDYKKAAVILGTKVITGYMEQYVYKRRADGLAIIDVEKTDEKVQSAINFLSQFNPEDILVFCKREAGWKAAEQLGVVTGARVFVRRYPAGVITNPTLPDFFEPKVLLIVDPWIDKNALNDAIRIGIPIISLADTNNVTNNLDLVVPTNNKTSSSIGLIFFLIAKGYAKAKNLPFKATLEDFGVEPVEDRVSSSSK